MELVASKEVCAIFAGLMNEGIDYGCLEVREHEEDIDFICDNDPEPNVPKWEQVGYAMNQKAALEEFLETPEANDRDLWESDLQSQLDEYDARLTKGLEYINKAKKEQDAALEKYIANKEQFQQLMEKLNVWTEKFSQLNDNEKSAKGRNFYNWKSALWDKANPVKDQRDIKWKEYQACKDKLSKYWDKWNQLRDTKRVLPDFHAMMNEDLNRYWSSADSEEIDSQLLLHRMDYSEDLRDAHIQEMKAYDREIFVNWDFHDKRMNQRIINEQLDINSLMESCPF